LPRCTQDQPHFPNAHFTLGLALSVEGNFQEALPEYEAPASSAPGSIIYRTTLAETLVRVGKTNERPGNFQEVLKLQPNYADAHWRYGMLLANTGNLKEALDHLRGGRSPSSYRPEVLESYFSFEGDGQSDAAVTQCREALRLQPDSPLALVNLAWILATDPSDHVRNGPEAVTLAERACHLTQIPRSVIPCHPRRRLRRSRAL